MKLHTRVGRSTFLTLITILNLLFLSIIGMNVLRMSTHAVDTPVIVPIIEASNTIEENIAAVPEKLRFAYSTPLTVIVGINDTNRFLTMSTDDLKRYTTTNVSTDSGEIRFHVNTAEFLPDLTKALSVYGTSFNPTTAYDAVGTALTEALRARAMGQPTETINVGVDSGPNTDGSVASKYIEIDLSQQKLFTFRNGKLMKAYRVSTGKDYPTPTGTFTILNKAGVGYSSIYHVWMPYWLGFAFSKELHAYFGIHELPYYYTAGTKIQRPRDFLGAPNTGGCVALDVGDAKEVYQLADIGTPVVIYE